MLSYSKRIVIVYSHILKVLWKKGVDICKRAGSIMLGSTPETLTIYHLPWTKGKSFNWDKTHLYKGFSKVLKDRGSFCPVLQSWL